MDKGLCAKCGNNPREYLCGLHSIDSRDVEADENNVVVKCRNFKEKEHE